MVAVVVVEAVNQTMRLKRLWLLPVATSIASALVIQKRDADFFSVRTHMHKDMSGRRGDPVDKYFREFTPEHVGFSTLLMDIIANNFNR